MEGGVRRRVARRGAGLVASCVLLAACSGGGSPEVEPTEDVATIGQPSEPPAASPSASAEAQVDVTVVPDVITPAYVDAVANTLYGIAGEVTAEVLAEPADPANNLTRDQVERLLDVFDLEEYTARLGAIEAYARDEARRENLLDAGEFSQLRWETVRLIEASDRCIVAVGYLDQSGTARDPAASDVLSALSLAPRRGTEEFNPTPWLAIDQLINLDADGNRNPDSVMLEADLETFGDLLLHSCEDGS